VREDVGYYKNYFVCQQHLLRRAILLSLEQWMPKVCNDSAVLEISVSLGPTEISQLYWASLPYYFFLFIAPCILICEYINQNRKSDFVTIQRFFGTGSSTVVFAGKWGWGLVSEEKWFNYRQVIEEKWSFWGSQGMFFGTRIVWLKELPVGEILRS